MERESDVAAVTSAVFRETLSHFASGVTVVTAETSAGPTGFTATGFTALSLVPPLILVCINKDASAHDAVVGATHFGVSILDVSQSWIALQFARSGVDRFEGITLALHGAGRAPLIGDALAHVECSKHGLYVEGDHTILVGEVVYAQARPGRPLLHFARRFGAFDEFA